MSLRNDFILAMCRDQGANKPAPMLLGPHAAIFTGKATVLDTLCRLIVAILPLAAGNPCSRGPQQQVKGHAVQHGGYQASGPPAARRQRQSRRRHNRGSPGPVCSPTREFLVKGVLKLALKAPRVSWEWQLQCHTDGHHHWQRGAGRRGAPVCPAAMLLLPPAPQQQPTAVALPA